MVWAMWSYFDVSQLDNQSAEDVNMAVVVTQPAPDESRVFSDVVWANMLLVPDNTYAQQFNKQQEELSRIKDERDKLRQQAQGRYEKAAALNDNVKYQQKGDMDYER